MKPLETEISTYRGMQSELEAVHKGKWAVVVADSLFGVFASFDAAASAAVARFGRGPYLIRQIGAPQMTLPASALYNPVHADH